MAITGTILANETDTACEFSYSINYDTVERYGHAHLSSDIACSQQTPIQ